MRLRQVRPGDVGSCVDVFYAAQDDLYRRLNIAPLPRNPQSLERLFRHVLGADPDRCWLAAEGRSVEAFGMAVLRGELHFLSFLFVRPEAQGGGLGTRVLERCLPPDGYRATCIEAIQPVSAALYGAAGLVPRVPIYTLVGQLRSPLPGLPDGLSLESFGEPGSDAELWALESADELDRAVLGISRLVDHRAWLGWQRRGFLLRRAAASGDGAAQGYGYAHESGRLGPLVVDDSAHLLPLLGELTTRVRPLDAWQVLVPGPAAGAFAGLLRAGLSLEGPPALFCATAAGIDHSRYLPGTFALP